MAKRKSRQRQQKAKTRQGDAGRQPPSSESSKGSRVVLSVVALGIVIAGVAYFASSNRRGPTEQMPTSRRADVGGSDVQRPAGSADAFARQGELLLNDGRADEAIDALQRAVLLDPSLDTAYTNLGNAYAKKGDYASAVAAYEKALAIRPASALAHMNMGIAQTALRQIPDAVAHLEKAVELAPDSAEAQFNLGKAYSDVGKYADAERALRGALTILPDYEEARYKLGVVLQRLGKTEEAVVVFRELLRRNPDHVGGHYHLTLSLIKRGSFDVAMQHFNEVIGLRPTDASLAYDIGQAFYDAHEYRNAGVAFKYATMVKPDLLRAYLKAGNGYQKITMLTEAESEFRAGIANAGPDAEKRVLVALHFNLGNALMVQEHASEAIEQYQQALDLEPTHANAQYGLGLAYEQESDFDSAIEAYEATLRLDPNHEGALTQLSLLREGRLPQATD